MAKKDFTKKIGRKNLSSLIPTEAPEVKREPNSESKPKPKTNLKSTSKPQKAAPKRTPEKKEELAQAESKKKNEGTTVTTFRIDNEHLFAIKALAYWDRKKIQQVMHEALEAYINATPESTLKKAKAEYGKQG